MTQAEVVDQRAAGRELAQVEKVRVVRQQLLEVGEPEVVEETRSGTASAVSRRTAVSPAAVSQLLAALDSAGLLERERLD